MPRRSKELCQFLSLESYKAAAQEGREAVGRGERHAMPRHAPHAIFTESSIYSSVSIKKTPDDSSLARLFPISFHIWAKEFSQML